MKIDDSIEEEIEEIMESGVLDEVRPCGDKIGKDYIQENLIDKYLQFFVENFKEEISENLNSDLVVRNRYCKWSNI